MQTTGFNDIDELLQALGAGVLAGMAVMVLMEIVSTSSTSRCYDYDRGEYLSPTAVRQLEHGNDVVLYRPAGADLRLSAEWQDDQAGG